VPIRLNSHKANVGRSLALNTPTPIVPSNGTFNIKKEEMAFRDGDNIIIKGIHDGANRKFSISLKTFEDSLNRIKKYHSTPTGELSGKDLGDFNDIRHIVSLGISAGAGDVIYEPINRVFGDVTHLVPGTVGAYLMGCRHHTDHKGNSACSAVCAGSIQLTVQGFSPCDILAVLYDRDKGFSRLNNPSSNTDAIIYYPESIGASHHSRQEIEQLMSYGVKRVKQMTYDSSGTHYKETTPDFIDIGHIVKRDIVPPTPVPVAPSGSSSSSGGTIAIVVIIILIILLLIYLASKKKGSKTVFFE